MAKSPFAKQHTGMNRIIYAAAIAAAMLVAASGCHSAATLPATGGQPVVDADPDVSAPRSL